MDRTIARGGAYLVWRKCHLTRQSTGPARKAAQAGYFYVSRLFPHMALAQTRALNVLALLLSLCVLGGCTVLQASKLLAPETFGLVQVTPSIYVEAGTDVRHRPNFAKR